MGIVSLRISLQAKGSEAEATEIKDLYVNLFKLYDQIWKNFVSNEEMTSKMQPSTG